ncbi:MAG: hypothetical protein V1912_01345 [bacterium]
MPYQSDYVLRLIEQMGGLIRRSMEKLGMRDAEEPCEIAGEAIGLALDMDPTLASRLSPQSLAALLELGNLDEHVIELVVQAIELDAEGLQSRGETTAAGVRHEQANAVRSRLGRMRAN